ncbi:MAG: hypothetical protein OEM05_14600 [Myxococcales bacterium]|nr:hypothetical protein [Myxococcales bacterium]
MDPIALPAGPGAVTADPGLLATLVLQDGTLERSRADVEVAIAAAARG